MTAAFLYLCLYAWHFVLPGYLIVRLLAIRRGAFLLTIAFAYTLLLLNLMPMEWLKAPVWAFTLAFNLQVGVLLAANVFAGYRRRGRFKLFPGITRVFSGILGARRLPGSRGEGHAMGRPATPAPLQFLRRRLARWWPPLVIVASVLVYLAWAGPYLELSADPWQHIVRLLNARQVSLDSGRFNPFGLGYGSGSLFDFLTCQQGHWYILQALLCRWSGLAIPDLPGLLTLANTVVFCLAIYWLALFLWSRQRIPRRQKIQAALWSVVFTVFWLGINIFAYIRYYVLAPAILNYVLYLAAVVLILDYFRSRSWWGPAVWLVPLLVMAMNVVHTQEAAFVFFMGMGILLVMEGQWAWGWGRRRKEESRGQGSGVGISRAIMVSLNSIRAPATNMLKIHLLFAVGLIIFGLLFYYSIHKPLAGYPAFLLRPLFPGEWLGQKWLIQPLTGQFAQVVTWWGVFVYGLFLLHIHYFKRQPFILAGMLMPLLIVFNPLTIVILSRWISDLNAIYRFNYMIPLSFVAGFLAMRFWIQIRSMLCWRRIWAAAALLGLLIPLTPVETLMGRLSNSRFFTLKPVAEGNDQRRWGDLIALVRKHPQVNVLTDSYTFTLLQRMDVKVLDGGWWVGPAAPGADRLALLRNLDRKQDWWLVVNRRNGDFSMNGARSGHWGGDAWTHFATAYSEDMLLFVKQHPELFREIGSKDRIQVYDIVESRLWE